MGKRRGIEFRQNIYFSRARRSDAPSSSEDENRNKYYRASEAYGSHRKVPDMLRFGPNFFFAKEEEEEY